MKIDKLKKEPKKKGKVISELTDGDILRNDYSKNKKSSKDLVKEPDLKAEYPKGDILSKEPVKNDKITTKKNQSIKEIQKKNKLKNNVINENELKNGTSYKGDLSEIDPLLKKDKVKIEPTKSDPEPIELADNIKKEFVNDGKMKFEYVNLIKKQTGDDKKIINYESEVTRKLYKNSEVDCEENGSKDVVKKSNSKKNVEIKKCPDCNYTRFVQFKYSIDNVLNF